MNIYSIIYIFIRQWTEKLGVEQLVTAEAFNTLSHIFFSADKINCSDLKGFCFFVAFFFFSSGISLRYRPQHRGHPGDPVKTSEASNSDHMII